MIARVAGVACVLTLSAGVAGTPPDHVVIVIEENHSYSQVIGSPDAPYINALAAGGASLTSMWGITHPSQPNYVQFFSGSNQGILDNSLAAAAPFSTPNLGAELLAAGRTFVGYCDGLPGEGSTVFSAGQYWRKHNPWVNWQASPPGPNQLLPALNQPFTAFPTDFEQLPTVAIVVPDQDHDMHDGTIAMADQWLRTNLGPYIDWARTHNSLFVLTWDEDGFFSRNQIPTILYGAMVRPGQYAETWTLHNLLRTVEDVYATGHAGAAANCRAIAGPFEGDPWTLTASFREGENGYNGAVDTFIEAGAPGASHALDATIVVDGLPLSQGLIRCDGIVGSLSGQVPPDSQVVSAKLLLLTGSVSGDSTVTEVALHRMLAPWTADTTWSSLANGVSPDGLEASISPDFTLLPQITNAWAIFDVTGAVQQWALQPLDNQGWALLPAGADGWRWTSSQAPSLADRPRLEVTFIPPCPTPVRGPVSATACVGGSVRLSAAFSGAAPLGYQWRRNGVAIQDGTTRWLTVISGAMSPTLVLSNVAGADAGAYECVCSNAGSCVPAVSRPATLSVCVADMDDGLGEGACDGGVTIDDLLYYLRILDAGLHRADVDDGTGSGTPDGGVTSDDLLYFLFRFDGGC